MHYPKKSSLRCQEEMLNKERAMGDLDFGDFEGRRNGKRPHLLTDADAPHGVPMRKDNVSGAIAPL